jgi:hypothetical protein
MSEIRLELGRLGIGRVVLNGVEIQDAITRVEIVAQAGELTRVRIEYFGAVSAELSDVIVTASRADRVTGAMDLMKP